MPGIDDENSPEQPKAKSGDSANKASPAQHGYAGEARDAAIAKAAAHLENANEQASAKPKERSKDTYKYLASLVSSSAARNQPNPKSFVGTAITSTEEDPNTSSNRPLNIGLICLSITIAGVLICGYLSTQKSSQAESLVEQASAKAKNPECKQLALQDLKNAENLGFRGKKLYMLRAAIERDLQDYQKASDDYSFVLKQDAAAANDAYIGRAFCQLRLGEFESAIADCNKTLKGELGPSDALRIRAIAYSHSGMLQAALEDCNILLASENKKSQNQQPPTKGEGSSSPPIISDAEIFGIRGLAYSKLDEPDKALLDLDKAIELGQQGVDLYLARARCFKIFGEWEKSLEDIESVLRIDGDNKEALKLRDEAVKQVES